MLNEEAPCERCGESKWKLKFKADYKWTRSGPWGVEWYECKNCRYENGETIHNQEDAYGEGRVGSASQGEES